jgi:hypothetical protein
MQMFGMEARILMSDVKPRKPVLRLVHNVIDELVKIERLISK